MYVLKITLLFNLMNTVDTRLYKNTGLEMDFEIFIKINK